MKLVEEVVYIIKKIEDSGFVAYVVGGAVRNFLLRKKIDDFDITTNAKPSDIMNLFDNTVPTGEEFGTITVVINKKNFEVTTFRKDGIYINGRKPENVQFSCKLLDDLYRRDFTINTLCADKNGNIIDLLNAREDVKNKIIRAVGNPRDRFEEDKLRMLRAIRFYSQFGGTIEEETYKAIKEKSNEFLCVSIERIQKEFNKIIMSNIPSKGIRALLDTGLMKYIIPEIYSCQNFVQNTPYHDKDVLEHILCVLDQTRPKLELRLAALLHDIAKPLSHTFDEKGISHFYGHEKTSASMSIEILKRLKYSNSTIDYVYKLVRYHLLKSEEIKEKAVKRFINNVGKDKLEDIFELQIADIKGKALPLEFDRVKTLKNKCRDILEKNEPLSVKDMKINGNDLKKIGYKEGKEIGKMLDKLMDIILENPEMNKKELLIDLAMKDIVYIMQK